MCFPARRVGEPVYLTRALASHEQSKQYKQRDDDEEENETDEGEGWQEGEFHQRCELLTGDVIVSRAFSQRQVSFSRRLAFGEREVICDLLSRNSLTSRDCIAALGALSVPDESARENLSKRSKDDEPSRRASASSRLLGKESAKRWESFAARSEARTSVVRFVA